MTTINVSNDTKELLDDQKRKIAKELMIDLNKVDYDMVVKALLKGEKK